MRVVCSVEIANNDDDDPSDWCAEQVEVSINAGKPKKMQLWFGRHRTQATKPSPVATSCLAVPESSTLGTPPAGDTSPPSPETTLSNAETVEMHSHSPVAGKLVPTADMLGEDVVTPGWKASDEWAPYNEVERAILGKLREWLGPARFAAVPQDTLACFVRGYAYRPDAAAASFVYLDRMLKWREGYGQNAVLAGAGGFAQFTGARRTQFDTALPGGYLGRDALGHPVVLDRFCNIPVKQFLGEWTDEEYFQQMVARREGVRAAANANSHELGKRVYKIVSVVDLHGLGFAHLTDKTFHARMKAFNGLFAWHYPESTYKLVVINAPHVFSALWKIAKHFVHPVTANKVMVHSGGAKKLFEDLGITLVRGMELNAKGQLVDNPPPWMETVEALLQAHGSEKLLGGFAPEEDRSAIEALSMAA